MTSALTGAIIQEVFGNSSNQTSANPSSNGYSSFDWSNLLGPVGNFAAGFINYQNAKKAAQRQFERQKELMDLQYNYNQRSLRESPTNYRYGLEAAGYNPILPFASSGASAMQGAPVGLGSVSSETPAFIDQNAMNGAMLLKMQKDKMQSEIDTMMSQRKVNNANAEYLFQKGISEEFEQKIKNLEVSRKSIENDWLPKKYKSEIYRNIADAEASLINAYAHSSEAETAQFNAKTNLRNVEATEQRNLNDYELKSEELSNDMEKYFMDKKFEAVKTILIYSLIFGGMKRAEPLVQGLVKAHGMSEVKSALGGQFVEKILRGQL